MSVLLIPDFGDDGDAWRAAAPAGWEVLALPGHGHAPAPRSGHYDPMAAVTLARWAIGPDPTGWTVVGVGESAHTALMLAGGDLCESVVIVDGLWGAIPTAEEAVDEMYAMIRDLADDPAAVGPAPVGAVDPRTSHGYGVTISTLFLQRFWAGVTIPVLAIETPASVTPPAEREQRLAWFGGEVRLVELEVGDAAAVIDACAAAPRW